MTSSARVIVVSIDGFRPDAVTTLGPGILPNFYRLRSEGAFTDNARTDFHYTETLPNHTSMITGRPVSGECGHGLTVNFGNENTNLHVDGYKASMFDVAHDHGLSTGLYSVKSKFGAFSGSYNEVNGAPDLTGEDNGRNKIDTLKVNITDDLSVARYLNGLQLLKWDLSMLHIGLPDIVGHSQGWSLNPTSSYMNAIITVDDYLGKILEAIETNGAFNGSTNLIVTADHGGAAIATRTHIDPELPENYTIPFYVWGPGVKAGADLYELNPDLADPGTGRPEFHGLDKPIRNGMVGNLALGILGLPPIPGSCFNVSQQLRVSDPTGFQDEYPWLDPDDDTNGNGFSNFFDYAIGAEPHGPHRPDLMPRMIRNEWSVNYRTNTTDVVARFEISTDFTTWWPLFKDVTYIPISSEETTGGKRVQIQIPMIARKSIYRMNFQR
ncbi:alkaline phosphatase family protein [Akkermansiaceae bacterium]|nr:alkaline phosphatase family protein [Akkermansiaceae bacterium]MDB4537857.1 alkaline phosphatase family protein [Akkermansiaceae bacterium]